MTMITCADCNKEISNTAPACPSCGWRNTNAAPTERPVGILLGIGIFLIPAIFAWFTLRKGHTTRAKVVSFGWLVISLLIVAGNESGTKRPVSVVPSISTSKPEAAQVMQVSIQQLLADYKDNEVGADNMYKGHFVQVTGIVSNIKKDILDNLYVTLGTGADFEIPEVQAFFDDSMNQHLASLSKGQELTVVCRIEGLMMNVLGKECIIQ